MKTPRTVLAVAVLAAFPMAHAQTAAPQPPAAERADGQGASMRYAQSLVDSIAAAHPDLLEIDLHAAPPGAAQSVIVAAKSRARVGRASDADDVAVFKSGQPRAEINRRGDRCGNPKSRRARWSAMVFP